MIRPLRRYHNYVWRILSILIPLVFLFSILLHPKYSDTPSHDRDFAISLDETGDTLLVRIDVLNPIRFPSCVLYGLRDEEDLFLGQLTKRGVYTFGIDSTINGIRLVDQIQKTEILQHRFNQ